MLEVNNQIILSTLEYIHAGGERDCETVVLWLGKRSGPSQPVEEVFCPNQIVDRDLFRIPPESMRELLTHLRQKRLQILAQVHSHPGHAFHSEADNEWAIVRHTGALSLVIPRFGSRTSTGSFADDIATFQLDASDIWQEVRSSDVLRIF